MRFLISLLLTLTIAYSISITPSIDSTWEGIRKGDFCSPTTTKTCACTDKCPANTSTYFYFYRHSDSYLPESGVIQHKFAVDTDMMVSIDYKFPVYYGGTFLFGFTFDDGTSATELKPFDVKELPHNFHRTQIRIYANETGYIQFSYCYLTSFGHLLESLTTMIITNLTWIPIN